jgi:hypothetical protein
LTVSVALLLTPLAVAVITTVVVADTCAVRMAKDLFLAPARIVMLVTVGAAIAELLLDNVTTILPGAAERSSVTVPVTLMPPPTTGFGLSVSDATPIGLTTTDTLLLMPLAVAVKVPLCVAETAAV